MTQYTTFEMQRKINNKNTTFLIDPFLATKRYLSWL